MKPSNIQRKLKGFHVPQTGSRQRQNTKGRKGCNKKQRRQISNLSWEEDNSWSEGQPDCSNCMKKRWKDGKPD